MVDGVIQVENSKSQKPVKFPVVGYTMYSRNKDTRIYHQLL